MKTDSLKSREFKPDNSKAKSVLDLRPALIAKLQQLVNAGSNGLYILSIDRLEPNVLDSKLDAYRVSIMPDSAALIKLDQSKAAPDNVFRISFDSLHIDGIGINDLLHKDKIDLESIYVSYPHIKMIHKERAYNNLKRKQNDSLTLYHRIMKEMKSVRIGKINIEHGMFIHQDIAHQNKVTKFNDVTIHINKLLIDSTTQHDNSRFFFAESALLTCGNYFFATPDSLYYFKAKTITVSGNEHTLTASNVTLLPRGSRDQFEKKLSHIQNMYTINIPKLSFTAINWYDLINHKNLVAKEMNIFSGSFSVYLNRALPLDTNKIQNFPNQVLMKIPLPISISKITVHNFNFNYTEYNPAIEKEGTLYIDEINSSIMNLTNMPSQIKVQRYSTLKGTAKFMHTVPMIAGFNFDMQHYKTGNFTADVHVGKLDTSIVNPIARPLGEFMIKTGTVSEGTAHIEGDNFGASGKGLLLYNDLRIEPLKKAPGKEGGLKKKTFTSFFANAFFIKNNNPSKGETPRSPEFTYERKPHSTFFSFAWKAISTGILKTIGLPTKLADK